MLASTLACTTAADALFKFRIHMYVPLRHEIFPLPRLYPDGKVADVLAPTHTCTTATALVNYTVGECCRDLAMFPSPPHGRLGDSRFARCLQGGGVFVRRGTVTISSCTISGNQASVRAHVLKFPSSRWDTMGKLLTCLPRLSLAKLRILRSTTELCTCHRDLENFPSPQWGNC